MGKKHRQVVHDPATDEWITIQTDRGDHTEPTPEGSSASHPAKRSTFSCEHGDSLTTSRVKVTNLGEMEATDQELQLKAPLVMLLVISSAVASALSFGVDTAIVKVGLFKTWLAGAGLFGSGSATSLSEILVDLVLITVARLLVSWAPAAAGSGIPEIKCMLTGGSLSKFLIPSVLVAKAIGLTCAMGSGLPLGKEGPFVHIAACVSAQLLTSKICGFHKLQGKRDAAEKVLLVAVSVGAGATFGTVLGGMLFALELMMPHMYDLATYRACFAASAVGSIMISMLKLAGTAGAAGMKPLISSNITAESARDAYTELLFIASCTLLGVFAGVLGGLFVRFHRQAAGAVKIARGLSDAPTVTKPANLSRARSLAKVAVEDMIDDDSSNSEEEGDGKVEPSEASDKQVALSHPLLAQKVKPRGSTIERIKSGIGGASLGRDLMLLYIFVIFSAAVKLHFTDYPMLGQGAPVIITSLFNRESQGFHPGSLVVLFLFKWVQSAIAISLPVPSGCVAPVLVLGALLGRAYGLMMPDCIMTVFDSGALEDQTANRFQYVARFAIVGSAAFSASVCQSISLAVMIMELISISGMIMPLILSTLVAVFVSQQIAPSIYDSILLMKKLPCMPALTAGHRSDIMVKFVMRRNLKKLCIRRDMTHEELCTLHSRLIDKKLDLAVPIIEIVDSHRILLGCVEMDCLDKMCNDFPEPDVSPEPRNSTTWHGGMLSMEAEEEERPSVDLLTAFSRRNALVEAVHVDATESLKDVYMEAQTVHYDRTMMVMHNGFLVGILTFQDLLRIA